ncbi:MAG: hypothetical protein GF364_01960 [Candidatus Lokiarchaeota archaeon]|nr:hypothetical protein [Candidatus Lokiarchaeota archaeon]
MNVGFIGCGMWAKEAYLPYFRNNKKYKLKALADIYPEDEGKTMACELGFEEYYDDYKLMLKKGGLDLIIISTPHYLHYTQAKDCLVRGIDVHIDKPIASSKKEAKHLVDLANKHNAKITVHTQKRFYRENIYLKKQIEIGKLGEVLFVEAKIWQKLFSDFSGSWRSKSDQAKGGIAMDSGYHMIDTLIYIFEDEAIDYLTGYKVNGDHESDRISSINLKINKASGIINIIRGVPESMQSEEITVIGSEGSIIVSRKKEEGTKFYTICHYHKGKLINYEKRIVLNGDQEKTAPLEYVLKGSSNKVIGSKSLKTIDILEKHYLN